MVQKPELNANLLDEIDALHESVENNLCKIDDELIQLQNYMREAQYALYQLRQMKSATERSYISELNDHKWQKVFPQINALADTFKQLQGLSR